MRISNDTEHGQGSHKGMLMQVSKLTQAKLAGHGLSLRAKSYLAYGILTVYAIFLSAYIFHQKGLLFDSTLMTPKRSSERQTSRCSSRLKRRSPP